MTLFNDKGDLDSAFRSLRGWNHFYTDVIRGRIRSIQLRATDAWKFFEKAAARIGEFPATDKNMRRRFHLKLYRFENAIIEESDPRGGRPEVTEECLAELGRQEVYNEIEDNHRTSSQGLYALHREDYEKAKRIFKNLIRKNINRISDEKTDYYLGLAVAHRGLEEFKEADRELENACLLVPTLDYSFNMGYYGCKASALLQLWGKDEEAEEWDGFMACLKLPEKTVELYRERANRILERSKVLERVFLF